MPTFDQVLNNAWPYVPFEGTGAMARPGLSDDNAARVVATSNLAHNAAHAKPGPSGSMINYNTQLDPQDETAFRNFLKNNSEILFHPDFPFSDYDMRGWWKARQIGGPHATVNLKPGHAYFPPFFETPYSGEFGPDSEFYTRNK